MDESLGLEVEGNKCSKPPACKSYGGPQLNTPFPLPHGSGNSILTSLFFPVCVSDVVENVWILLFFLCPLHVYISMNTKLLQTCPNAFMTLFVVRLRGLCIYDLLHWEIPGAGFLPAFVSPQREESLGLCVSLLEP